MAGIVREISGRKVIQWDSPTTKNILIHNNTVNPRDYNGKTIYSAGGSLGAWLNLGDVIEVESESDTLLTCKVVKPAVVAGGDNTEVVMELREIKELLKEFITETKKSQVTKKPEKAQEPKDEVFTIKGIKCKIDTNPQPGYKYIPVWESDMDTVPKWTEEYGIINGKI